MKHLKHIFPLLLLIILSGCTDDTLQWGGAVNSEDEIAIAFTAPGDMTVVDMATRALTLPSTEIDGLDLLIFDTDGKLASGQYFPKNQFIDGTSGAKAVKMKRQFAAAGTWYLIANAHAKISALNLYDSNGLPVGSTSLADFEETELSLSEALGETNGDKAILVAKQTVESIPSPSSPAMSAFPLSRRFARVTMKVAAGVEFKATGIALIRTPEKTKIDGTPTAFSDFDASAATLEFFSLPVPDKMQTPEPYPEARLVIKGMNPTGRDTDDKPTYDGASETYFAYKFPGKIECDHDYALTLKSVVGAGAATPEEAAANPSAVIEYKDNYESSRNIVTDGERVIALPDTLRIAAEATAMTFDVVWRGKDKDDLLYYGSGDDLVEANSSVDSWIKTLTASAPVEITDSDAAGSDFKRFKTVFTLSLTQNNGSAREAQLCFRLRDSEALLPVLVAEQASADINLDDSMDIKLVISRGSQKTEISNYLLFIGNNPADGDKSEGIAPEANGGRVRNAGLHIPMPNGGATYTYTLSGITGWTLSYGKNFPESLKAAKTGDTYTFTFKDDALQASSYIVYEDAIVLNKDDRTLTLDLYHTGFFHPYAGKWYYYEVFTAGGQQWLDRNIGAASAGMAHLTDSYLAGSGWPMAEEAAGARFSLADAQKNDGSVAPPGWRLPTQGEFETLAMQSGFSSDRFTTGGQTIFLPSYTFRASTSSRTGTLSQSSIRAYFPHNRYAEGSSPAGDEGAGYYWTATNTDNAQYYRSMKFVGQNVTPENMLTSRRLSLRCVSGESVDNSTVLYSCQVKGYTHVFLYAEKNGEKTYLNTWPGTQVANDQTKDIRYNPFSFTSYVDYVADGYSLYVIFNNPSSTGTISNVTAEAARARQGIPFIAGSDNHNGEAYDSSLTGDDKLVYGWKGSDIVLKGNWRDKYVAPVSEYRYALKGNFNGENWDAAKSSGYEFSSDGSSLWTLDMEVNSTGEFVILRKESTQSGWNNDNDWGKTNPSMDVKLNQAMTVSTGLGDGYNWRFTETGKYTLKLDVSAMTLTVTKEQTEEPEPDPADNYFQLKYLSGSAVKMTYDEGKGLWAALNQNLKASNGAFRIQEMKSDDTFVKSYRPSASANITYSEAIQSNTTSAYNYTPQEDCECNLYFDPSTATLLVVPTDVLKWWVNIPGDHNEWGDNGVQPDYDGIARHTITMGKNGFKIKVYKNSDDWRSTGAAVSQNQWVSITGNSNNNMTVSGASDGDTFLFEWNCAQAKLRITKKSSTGLRRK